MRWERVHFENRETVVTLLCAASFIPAAREALKSMRADLEAHIAADPVFKTNHASHDPGRGASGIVRDMCSVSQQAGVGPMASVAGAFALGALEAMLKSGANEGIVDNGGDIALQVREPVLVGIFGGESSVQNLAFQVEPQDAVLGICTSSGTVGHSFSYGKADAAVVISENVMLADAAATALGNRVRSPADLKSCFGFLEPMQEIQGALVLFEERIALWGELPRLVRARVDERRITRGQDAQRFGNRTTPVFSI